MTLLVQYLQHIIFLKKKGLLKYCQLEKPIYYFVLQDNETMAGVYVVHLNATSSMLDKSVSCVFWLKMLVEMY